MWRRFLSPAWLAGHLLVIAAVLVCLRLGWWQWERSREALGDAQNLGYALLWPAFGAAFVYMWLRFLHLELLKDREADEELADLLTEHLDLGDGDRVDASGSATEASVVPAGAPADRPEPSPDLAANLDAERPDRVGADADEETVGVGEATDPTRSDRRRRQSRPSRGVTIAVATVGDEDDDPNSQLNAYNRALAALAEEDARRAR